MAVAIKKIMGIPRSAHQIADDPLMSDANLVGYWKFESDGADSKGSNNLIGSGTPTFTAAKFNNGLTLVAASSQFEKIADNAALSITGDISISAWVKITSVTGDQAIVAKYDYTNNQRSYTFYIESGKLKFHFSHTGTTAGTQLLGSTTLSTGVLYHVACSIDVSAATGTFYVNAVADTTTVNASASTAINDGTAYLGVGAFVDYAGNALSGYLGGQIDDLAIFNRLLTPTEIYRLYNGNIKKLMGKNITGGNEIASMPLASDANLKAYYKLETGALTTDSSGNSKTLTNNGTATEGTGKFGVCADTGASNSTKWLSINDNLGIDGGAITLSCWIKLNAEPTNTTAFAFIFQGNANTKVANYIRYYNAAGVYTLYYARDKLGIAETTVTRVGSLGISAWHHIAYTYDATNIRGYLDGVLLGTTAGSGNGNNASSANSFSLGGYNWNYSGTPSYLPSCLTDDVAVYNRALTDIEISNIYNTQIKKFMGVSNV